MGGILSLVTPLLLHMFLSEGVTAILSSRFSQTASAAAASVVVIIPAWLMFRKDKKMGWTAQKNMSWRGGLVYGIFCFAAGGILNLLWSNVMNLVGITQVFSNQTQEQLLAAEPGIQLIGLGILVPIAEELVFRGLIYNRMKRFFPVWMAVVFSALLFAVYHGNPIQMIFALPMAAALACAYEHGKWFGFPVLFHMGSNLTAILINLR